MENKDIHKSLDRAELRDFLGQELRKAFDKSGFNDVKHLEKEFIKIQEQLKNARIKEAIELILKEQNWSEFDISGYIDYDDNYFPFIGTKKEYAELIR